VGESAQRCHLDSNETKVKSHPHLNLKKKKKTFAGQPCLQDSKETNMKMRKSLADQPCLRDSKEMIELNKPKKTAQVVLMKAMMR